MAQLQSTPLRIAVTSATSLVGRMLVPALRANGYHVSALVRRAASLPADAVLTDWLVAPAAQQALEAADVIVHLSGEIQARSWTAYHAANVATTKRVAAALRAGRAQRVLFISYPNASPAATNLFLRAKGQAEHLLARSGKDTLVFRAQAIINTPQEPGPAEQALIATPGGTVRTLGSGTQPIFTIYRPDVIAALVRAIAHGRPGTYDLVGPDALTMDGLIYLLNRDTKVHIAHTPEWAARLLSHVVPDLPPSFVDLYFQRYTMDGASAVREFGLQLTSLHSVWTAPTADHRSRGVA